MNTYRLGMGGRIAGLLVAAFLVLPLVVVGLTAFSNSALLNFPPSGYSTRWFSNITSDPDWRSAMSTSLRIGLTSAGISLLLGVPLGLGLGRGRIGRIRVVQALVAAPQIIPVVTLAVGFFFLSVKLRLLGTILPLIIAHSTLGIPLVVLTVVATVRGLDPSLEPAARTLGASAPRTLRSITLPLLAPGIIAGAVFAFLASWDDIVNAVFLATPTVRTFPLLLWTQMQYNLTPVVPAAAVFLSAVSLGLVTITALLYALYRRRVSKQVAENIIFRQGDSQ